MTNPSTEQISKTLISIHGDSHAQRIADGLERVARLWVEEDGNQQEFEAFCEQYFVSDPGDLDRLLCRFETLLVSVHGHLSEISRDLRRWTDLRGDTYEGVDDLLAVIADWGCSGCSADIDGDGFVGVNDLLSIISGWGSCP